MRASNVRNAFLAVMAALTLGGCFVEAEADTVTITTPPPPFQVVGIPAELQIPGLLDIVGSLTYVEIPIGNAEGTGFVTASRTFGPITLEGTLNVNQAVLELDPPAQNASLAGIKTLELWQISRKDCQPDDATCRVKVAEYTGGGTAGRIALAGTGVNGLPFLFTDPQTNKKAFLLQLQGTGIFPTVNWTGKVTLDCHLKDRGTWP